MRFWIQIALDIKCSLKKNFQNTCCLLHPFCLVRHNKKINENFRKLRSPHNAAEADLIDFTPQIISL